MYDITTILEALLLLAGTIVTYVLIPYIKSKTTEKQQEDIKEWVRIAVTAAEQIYNGTGRGTEKKQYVLDWLSKNNIKVDSEKLDALIEAAVYDFTV